MEEASLPQIMLYGWEEKICTWTKQMLERLGLNLVDSWQELCKDRDSWYQQYQEGLLKLSQVGKSLSVANQQPHCWCEGIFKRTGNYARYQKYSIPTSCSPMLELNTYNIYNTQNTTHNSYKTNIITRKLCKNSLTSNQKISRTGVHHACMRARAHVYECMHMCKHVV